MFSVTLLSMTFDATRQQSLDLPRQDTTSPDDYSLSIEEAVLRYEHAGHPRTIRSIQRYCAQGHLDCLRQQTQFGERYLITAASVARHIAQIEEITRTTSRDLPRPIAATAVNDNATDKPRHDPATQDALPRLVATSVAPEMSHEAQQPPATTSHDEPRQVATSPDIAGKYIERLEGEVDFLREEIATKNAQIKELTERSRETNVLIGGLQRMLAPLLGSPHPYAPKSDSESA